MDVDMLIKAMAMAFFLTGAIGVAFGGYVAIADDEAVQWMLFDD